MQKKSSIDYMLVVTGKFTNETFDPRSIGGSCVFGSDACLALIHNDKVMLASLSNLRKLLISAFNTCKKCRNAGISCDQIDC